MYGAEAWGIENCTVLERVYAKVCKYTSLNKCIHKYGRSIYDETGELSLSLRVKCTILNTGVD